MNFFYQAYMIYRSSLPSTVSPKGLVHFLDFFSKLVSQNSVYCEESRYFSCNIEYLLWDQKVNRVIVKSHYLNLRYLRTPCTTKVFLSRFQMHTLHTQLTKHIRQPGIRGQLNFWSTKNMHRMQINLKIGRQSEILPSMYLLHWYVLICFVIASMQYLPISFISKCN